MDISVDLLTELTNWDKTSKSTIDTKPNNVGNLSKKAAFDLEIDVTLCIRKYWT